MKVARAADFQKRRVQWLWKPFIQRGAINLLTGGPGTGKSTISCDIAAALSVGRPLPGESEAAAEERGVIKTLMLNAEDDIEDTIIWRLDNQGADRQNIYLSTITEPIGKEQCDWLYDFIRANNVGLTTVDPVQAWVGQDTDMYRPNHMRAWGNQFKNLTALTGCTFLWVRHRRKGDADDANSINSGLGSIDLSGIVRSEIGAVETKQGTKITRIKGNIGRTKDSLKYEIKSTDDPENDHGQLFWLGEVAQETKTARRNGEEVKPSQKETRASADGWLMTLLMQGEWTRRQVVDAGKAVGYSEHHVKEAIKRNAVEENGLIRYRRSTKADEQQPDTTNS